MTTSINISLNIPPDYGVARLTQQLTEYAQRLVAEDILSQEETDKIVLSPEMISIAKQAEQDYREGKCVTMDGFDYEGIGDDIYRYILLPNKPGFKKV